MEKINYSFYKNETIFIYKYKIKPHIIKGKPS